MSKFSSSMDKFFRLDGKVAIVTGGMLPKHENIVLNV